MPKERHLRQTFTQGKRKNNNSDFAVIAFLSIKMRMSKVCCRLHLLLNRQSWSYSNIRSSLLLYFSLETECINAEYPFMASINNCLKADSNGFHRVVHSMYYVLHTRVKLQSISYIDGLNGGKISSVLKLIIPALPASKCFTYHD